MPEVAEGGSLISDRFGIGSCMYWVLGIRTGNAMNAPGVWLILRALELVGVLIFRNIIHLNVPALDGNCGVSGLSARISNFYSWSAVQSSYIQICLSIVNHITVFGVNKSD